MHCVHRTMSGRPHSAQSTFTPPLRVFQHVCTTTAAERQCSVFEVHCSLCEIHCPEFWSIWYLETIAMQSWSTRLTKHSKVQSPTICLLRWLLIGLQSLYLAVNTVETVAWYGDKKLKKKEITKIWKCKCFWCYIWSWGAPVNLLKFLSLFPLTQFFSSAAAMNTVWIKSPYKIIMLAEEILW